ncbi:MAG TPA: hypothetical protein PKD54_12525, partial [Pirellulaceae bacterium]|nr:hypothetical protein [Pirellulaceae bacterium]
MLHPLMEVVELMRPRLPIGCRAAFCAQCLCLNKHLIYDNPKESWRRAVGSDTRDWVRYQVCSICQHRSPHRRRDPFVDLVTAAHKSIEELWEQTQNEDTAGRSLDHMARELADLTTSDQRKTLAMTSAAYALQDRLIDWQRALDKSIITLLLFGSIVLLAMTVNWPHAAALLVALFPAAFVYRLRAMHRFEQRDLGPAILSFLEGTRIGERE